MLWTMRFSESGFPSKVVSDKNNISRSLNKLTDGEARKVITSIKTENGFRAQHETAHEARPKHDVEAGRGVGGLQWTGWQASANT